MKNLKTISFLLVVFAALYGCSKSSTKLITGKWYESTDQVDSIKNGQSRTVNSDSSPDGSYLQLNANGTGTVYNPPYGSYPDTTITITYTLSGSVFTINYPAYHVYGYSYDAHSTPWTVVNLTSSELNLKYTQPGADPNSAAGEFVEYVSFKK